MKGGEDDSGKALQRKDLVTVVKKDVKGRGKISIFQGNKDRGCVPVI